MITLYKKSAGGRKFNLVDEHGTTVVGGFIGDSFAREWAHENGYFIAKQPYTPADIEAESIGSGK